MEVIFDGILLNSGSFCAHITKKWGFFDMKRLRFCKKVLLSVIHITNDKILG